MNEQVGHDPDAGRTPAWCEWRRGGSPLLLVAPHGGRRPPINAAAPPPQLRVNDLYTPELTRILMDRLDATGIINAGQDRNTLDLNRTSQVRQRAPWWLALLVREIEVILGRHGHAEVVFVHGWNTGQPQCDIGVGAVERGGEVRPTGGAQLTILPNYLRQRIGAFRAACAQRMITTSIGEKYPGSHRNNLLQLFTERAIAPADPVARRLGRWAAEQRLNACQLELGIPLRWPGVWRDRFLDAAAEGFGWSRRPGSGRRLLRAERTRARRDSVRGSRVAALQFYDPAADAGMLASLGRAGPQVIGARLLLFLGGQRVALFTGEEPDVPGQRVLPLRFTSQDDVLRMDFTAPMLLIEDAAVCLDLEAALHAARVVEAEVHLRVACGQRKRPAPALAFGTVDGELTVAGRRWRVHAGGFLTGSALRATGPRQQVMLAANFAAAGAVLSRVVGGESHSLGLHFTADAVRSLDGMRIEIATDGDAYTPATFALLSDGQPPLSGQALSRMSILRPAGRGGYVRVTFGVARFCWRSERGSGLYEYARPVLEPGGAYARRGSSAVKLP
ncbi:MAG: hypothetical protein ACE5I7_19640 [Candidatus Binatia bacterium]